ncbi:MAG: polysaccharide biosynthesis C-terminal domain-containing protein [Deltaproteobacteria bacterium]|nr:polysaccharide biosynthesis C-terminal domain-containing protein [Deltaproteobacteria bacterium]
MKAVFQVFSFDVVSKVVLGLMAMALIRYMPGAEYAEYTFAVSVVSVATGTLSSAFNRVYIVGYGRLGLGNEVTPFFGFQLLAIGAVAAAAYPFAGRTGGLFWFMALVVLSQCSSEFAKTIFQRELKFIRFSMVEFARSLLFAGGIVALVIWVGHRMEAWQALVVQALAGFLVFPAVAGRMDLRRLFDVQTAVRLSRQIFAGDYRYLFGYFFVLAFFSQIDVFMLKTLGTGHMVATYGTAFRYYNMVLLALAAVHTVLLPMVQNAGSAEELDGVYRKSWRLLGVFAPCVLLGAWAAQWIMPAIDMGKYPGAVTVFRVLSVSAIASFAFSPYVNLVMRFEAFRFLLLLVCAAAVASVALNALLIPRFHETGAALATLGSFLFVNGAIYIKARGLRARLSGAAGVGAGA